MQRSLNIRPSLAIMRRTARACMPRKSHTKSPEKARSGRMRADVVLKALRELREKMVLAESEASPLIGSACPASAQDAGNLVHYLAMRRVDLRRLQSQLSRLGLSSLGRAEVDALATVQAVIAMLSLALEGVGSAPRHLERVDRHGAARLSRHAETLLGPLPPKRRTRVMVTLPSQAAEDQQLARELIRAGMNVARINCAHDDQAAWTRMVRNIRSAAASQSRTCRIVMDLPGPKLRTGDMPPGPRVVKVRPARDAVGLVTTPARVWIAPLDIAPPQKGMAHVPIDAGFVRSARVGDLVGFSDSRGRRRAMPIVRRTKGGLECVLDRTAYIVDGTRMWLRRGSQRMTFALATPIPALPGELRLLPGDLVELSAHGTPAKNKPAFKARTPNQVTCSLPSVLTKLRPGHRVIFDDGKIVAKTLKCSPTRALLRVVAARSTGATLRAEKGINLPDTDLDLPSLTQDDLEALPFIAKHADAVCYSFVQSPDDIAALYRRLDKLRANRLGVILKIETRKSFEQLPRLLFTAMRRTNIGVMIARGDLAVEMGFERLAEVQEEILWLSEAARVPAIWATQVLETLASRGLPSRAEITDAAMGQRAECVMLNKGAYILGAVRVLDDILRRMHGHQSKKIARLRRLNVARLGE